MATREQPKDMLLVEYGSDMEGVIDDALDAYDWGLVDDLTPIRLLFADLCEEVEDRSF